MANTNTNVTPDVVVNEVLPAFVAGLVGLDAFSKSFEATNGQGQDLGLDDVVRVPVISARSAATFSSYETETGDTLTGTAVTLSERKHTPFYNSDADRALPPSAWLAKAGQSAYATGASVFSYAIGLYTASTFGDTDGTSKIIKAATSFGISDVVDMMKLLRKRNAVAAGEIPALIVNEDYAAALIHDAGVMNVSARGATDIQMTGWFDMPLLGVRVFRTNAFPSALTSENTGGILCVKSSLAVAMTPVRPKRSDLAAAAGLQYAEIQHPESGVRLGYREHYNTASGKTYGNTEILFGASAVQTTGAVRVVSA